VSHECRCRWEVPPRCTYPEPRFIPAKLPFYTAGMESARRSLGVPSLGLSNTGIPYSDLQRD
jgi:hypothetical protein